MTSQISVDVDNLSKLYLLYDRPVDRLKQSLFGRLGKNYARSFWALRGVSFQVEKGEALGIIGRNGSGKSTLLQVIAGILQPTGGRFSINGRLTALLELGAGFNPEFTGRENIFLNGATLGFSEREMREKADEIIDFAQIGDFIDQPVNIYSSGMFVRLAFSIATHVDPDILVIDEALAVGDTGFVIKCMNRMKSMRERGATILLVTHDIQTVRSFCNTALWLDHGSVQDYGSPLSVTARYLQFLSEDQLQKDQTKVDTPSVKQSLVELDEYSTRYISIENKPDLIRWGTGDIRIEKFTINNGEANQEVVFDHGKQIHLEIIARANRDFSAGEIGFAFAFRNIKGLDLITVTTLEQDCQIPAMKEGQTIRLVFDLLNILGPGDYMLVLNAEHREGSKSTYYDFVENAAVFTVTTDRPIFSLVLPPVVQKVFVQ